MYSDYQKNKWTHWVSGIVSRLRVEGPDMNIKMTERQIFFRQAVREMQRSYCLLNLTTKFNPYLDLHCFQVLTSVTQ